MKSITRILCAAGVAMGLAGFANGAAAQDNRDTMNDTNQFNTTAFQRGLYVGGGLGWGWADDDDDWTWKGFGGYRLNQYAAVQMFYADLADITVAGVSSDVDTVGAEFLLGMPLNDNMAIYGKAGGHNYDEPGSGRNMGWLVGAGAEFAVAENLSVRTEWTHYDMRSDEVNDLSASLVFGF